jgi:hypothetical protein
MKNDFEIDSASEEDFIYWINERTSIYLKRLQGLSKPWTNDPILRKYKFTNAYRQCDKTTRALQENILQKIPEDQHLKILFNVIWFRMFGWIELTEFGPLNSVDELEPLLCQRYHSGSQIFTGAYMAWGGHGGEAKFKCYIDVLREEIEPSLEGLLCVAEANNTMESVFRLLGEFTGIGKFFAYEMACDLRFTPILFNATDKLTWGNVGPGAKRGMLRLGIEPSLEGMLYLYDYVLPKLEHLEEMERLRFPFELREIEHSLCEFDKYQRVLNNEGRIKGKYDGE